MPHQFKKHYLLDEARSLLPLVKVWISELVKLRNQIGKHEKWSASRLKKGLDIGGEKPNAWVRDLSRFQEVAQEFQVREILLKDIDRGLIDFPALRDGKEIFLCWELGESDILHWHDLDSGYAGRQPIDPKPPS